MSLVCTTQNSKLEYFSVLIFSMHFWRRKWQPTPVFLPGESHARRSLVGYSPRGHRESDTTEQLHYHYAFYVGDLNPDFKSDLKTF